MKPDAEDYLERIDRESKELQEVMSTQKEIEISRHKRSQQGT